jgi:hypothetical protein
MYVQTILILAVFATAQALIAMPEEVRQELDREAIEAMAKRANIDMASFKERTPEQRLKLEKEREERRERDGSKFRPKLEQV